MATKKKKADPKDPNNRIVAQNKKARHLYNIVDTYEAGLVLMGTEVKSLRDGGVSITEGFVQEYNGELWLEAINIAEYGHGSWTNHAARRRRKLLLHRQEINKLIQKLKETGYTIVPLKLYFVSGRAKVEIALATGKRDYDKRQALRERQDNLEAARAMRYKNLG
ncbi:MULTISPECIES: SsrA-binding protein SmpB [unclassified Rothia (in: high G+C Gram-positive bacteria)]|uniref:SsrA-binding protein SmpB n=1 Tax=unclassified Rothia (in: high G+C Gram-positive bacteria) TaxID=2689056 RepID=UPI001959DE3B|nr:MULTISPECIES: SsrA-binding protein SmpB [unclassified Rothia (in: high G+C Gram-positive bacteria)]MBM7051032.1 SsrA-binding protein SmpB [Rothia sp. ZJ1223]QRZ62263.1 SsrA-binding protein SmpB [Rothia sp. ZJ932]